MPTESDLNRIIILFNNLQCTHTNQFTQSCMAATYRGNIKSIFLRTHFHPWLRDIPKLRHQRGWVGGGVRKCQFSMMFNSIYADVGWMDGSEKV